MIYVFSLYHKVRSSRIYLKNTNDANRLCPDFYSDFISTLSKEDLKSLNEIASSVNEYLSYNISERYDAAIISSQKNFYKSKNIEFLEKKYSIHPHTHAYREIYVTVFTF